MQPDAARIDARLLPQPSHAGGGVARQIVRRGLTPVAGGLPHPAFVVDQRRDAVGGELHREEARGPASFGPGPVQEHDGGDGG
jgi:hypothetical protein